MAFSLNPVPPSWEPVFYAIPFFLLTMALELYVSYRNNLHLYEPSDAWSSIGMGLGSLVVNTLMKALAFMLYSYLFSFALFPEISWTVYGWLLILLADDFTFYWHHRLSHEIRFFWAAHVNHHSSVTLNLATALRQSWTELLYKYIWWSWLPLIGFHPVMILMMMSISLIYQYWPHTELIRKMPRWFEFIFNTPSHHRVHHASNIKYLDRNHGGILIIWDRLFGTFTEEDNEKPVYGITRNISSHHLLHIAFHEYHNLWNDIRRATRWSDKLRYLYMPPGWSHDGEDLRAATLRRKAGVSD